MKTQFTQLDNITGNNVTANAVKKAGREHHESQRPLLIISQLFFAVFVIGFIGYYFDRVLQACLFRREGRTLS
jgi:hypothetical protein